jgi:hypothetical protein
MSNLSRKRAFVVILSLGMAIAMAGVAEAQRRERGGIRPGNVSPARLLVIESVRADLNLTESQKIEARKINEALTNGRQTLFAKVTKESGQRGPKVAELNKKAAADIAAMLDETQEKRLQEIVLQVNGASQLMRKDIRDALRISEGQQARLKEIRRENVEARSEALANYDGDRLAKMVELQKAADERLLAVLTAEQRQQFEAMQGKKIKLDLFPERASP